MSGVLLEWTVDGPGKILRRAATCHAAKCLAKQHFPVGPVAIVHEPSGERWQRIKGRWRRDDAPRQCETAA